MNIFLFTEIASLGLLFLSCISFITIGIGTFKKKNRIGFWNSKHFIFHLGEPFEKIFSLLGVCYLAALMDLVGARVSIGNNNIACFEPLFYFIFDSKRSAA